MVLVIDHTPSATRSATSDIAAPDPIDRKPTARSNASTAPWPTNGPTPGYTPATPNAMPSTHAGYTPTITIAATPHSAVNHQPAVYLTSQVSTSSPELHYPENRRTGE